MLCKLCCNKENCKKYNTWLTRSQDTLSKQLPKEENFEDLRGRLNPGKGRAAFTKSAKQSDNDFDSDMI